MTEPNDALWTRLLAALEAPCADCGGAGTVHAPAWRAWHERAGELVRVAQAARRATDLRQARPAVPQGARPTVPEGVPRISPEAAREAAETPAIVTAIDRAIGDHMNTRPDGPERVRCTTCGGCGRTLTAAGTRLTEFLARHGLVLACPDLNSRGGGDVQPDVHATEDPPSGTHVGAT
ncbi:hypothetical protein [Actinomadura sp. 21ATH]|uniref:hypothetical protein n=1 Tax=Actinomadura sp. 21ATH TaxID=1735444 RepID=UPI0035C149F1